MTASSPSASSPDVSAAPAAPSGRGRALAGLVLALLSVALYLPTVDHHLVYDDDFLISPALNRSMIPVRSDLGAALDLFTQEYWEGVNPENTPEYKPHGQALYRPLTLFIWAVTQNLTADGPFDSQRGAAPYHWISILVNAAVVWLFFLVLCALFDRTRLAFVAALLYAVHPLHSEATAYVAGLSDQLAAATVLIALLCFLRIHRKQDGLAVGAWLGLLLTLFLGLMAKESAVLALAAVALTDMVLSLRGQALAMGRRLLVYGGMLAVLAGQLMIRLQVIGYLQPRSETIGRLDNPMVVYADDFGLRAANALKLVAKYVWLVLWPKDLSIDYSYNAIPLSDSWMDAEPLAATILVVAMLLVGLVGLRRRPAFAWGLLFFLGTTVFISNLFVPIGTIFADRLMYLPTLGAALAVGALVDPLLGPRDRGASNPLGLLVLVLLAGALGYRTYERNEDFRTTRSLFESAEDVVPESARVHYMLGSLYANESLLNAAIDKLETAVEKDPNFVQGWIQLGDVYVADRNYDKALEIYTKILSMLRFSQSDPSVVAALRALLLNKQATAKRLNGDLDGALADLEEAMQAGGAETPAAIISWVNIQQNQGRYADTIPILRQAVADYPGEQNVLMALARSAVGAGDKEAYDEALEALKQTELGRPRAMAMEAEVEYERAVAQRDAAARDAAIVKFNEVIDLDDSLATPYYYNGRYLIETQRAFQDGLAQYDEALARDPDHPGALLYKSLALIELQRFDEATATLALLENELPNEATFTLQAEVAFKQGDLEAQEAAFAKLEELGKVPVQILLNRSQAYSSTGDLDRAIEVVEQAMANPETANEPLVLRTLGLLLLDAGRCEEALATFQLQRQAEMTIADPEFLGDLFLPINTARAMGCAGQEVAALGELATAEARLAEFADQPSLQLQLQVGVMHRRAELLLTAGSPVADPAQGLDLATRALDLTGRQSPSLYDLVITGLVANGDLGAALDAANEAAAVPTFSKLPTYYAGIVAALEQAIAGDRAGAAAALRQVVFDPAYDDGARNLERLARQLEG